MIDPNVEAKYRALGCDIRVIDDKELKEVKDYIQTNLSHHAYFKTLPNIVNVYEITRNDERKSFLNKIGNEKVFRLISIILIFRIQVDVSWLKNGQLGWDIDKRCIDATSRHKIRCP